MGIESIARENTFNNVAIIFGVTGLVGKELARRLIATKKWKVYGVARIPGNLSLKSLNYTFISCDLLNSTETRQKLSFLQDITHVFWLTWATEHVYDMKRCCEQNKLMMSNALDALLPAKSLKHVSLQTGMKHYVSLEGPFEGNRAVLYEETCPRVGSGINNFYYVLEDLVKDRLAGNVAWSVQRPGLILGSSHRTCYNFMGSICVYGAICKRNNLPFVFGGSRECWEEAILDGSDARLVAEQHFWAATNGDIQSTEGQPFNAINGSVFTWKEIWPSLGKKFGLETPKDMFQEDFRYAKALSDKQEVWKEIVVKEGLIPTEMEDLANWEFLDVLFRCPVKMLGSREKADRFGFKMRYNTLDSIMYWIDFMKDEKLIP